MGELSPSKIKAAIAKTGFPLELRVSRLLDMSGFYIAPNLYYIDADEEKGREIDLRALKNIRTHEPGRPWIRYALMVECKKLDRPWVVLTSPRARYDKWIDEVDFRGLMRGKEQLQRLPWHEDLELPDLAAVHPYFTREMLGRSFFEAFRSSKESEDEAEGQTGAGATNAQSRSAQTWEASRIFGAIATSVKATLAMHADQFGGAPGQSICFYYPLVVVDGLLFEGYLEGDEVEVKEVDSTIVSFFYASPKYGHHKFAVPIVRFGVLQEFLTQMDTAHEALAVKIEGDLEGAQST